MDMNMDGVSDDWDRWVDLWAEQWDFRLNKWRLEYWLTEISSAF